MWSTAIIITAAAMEKTFWRSVGHNPKVVDAAICHTIFVVYVQYILHYTYIHMYNAGKTGAALVRMGS
jgi:hypothetical protein